ncbi:MAG: GntR family transcriptional regulator [Ignavibacteriaceae bacterium]|nr:GntR family transcriptional regulator [Ignavibacteriaceae bacterium]
MVMEINHESALPLHTQVYTLLKEMIALPEYSSGKLLPNEIEIAKRLGISRNTVRHATNKLVYEGLLIRKKGIGTKVSQSNNVTTRLDSWHSFTQEMNQKHIPFKTYEINVTWIKPDEAISKFFGISSEREVLCMERLRGLESGPIVYFISYFHPRVGLTGKEDFSKPLYKMLEEEFATVVTTSREEISAKLADETLAEKLKIKTGSPVLKRKRYVLDPGGRPVEFNIGYYNAEHFTYSIEIKRGKNKNT